MSWLWSDEPPRSFRDFRRVADPPEDPTDRHTLALARAQRTRDYFVALEEMKMLQEQLSLCYVKAGVNAREDCKELALAYIGKTRARNYGAADPSGTKNMTKVRARAPCPERRASRSGRSDPCACADHTLRRRITKRGRRSRRRPTRRLPSSHAPLRSTG
jgi:hypothetical protein